MRTLIENGTVIAWVDNRHKIFEPGVVVFAGNEIEFVGGRYDGEVDTLVDATAGTVYRISEIEDNPITLNANLGYYTNFVNLLDLVAITVPNWFLYDGSPMGITIVGPTFSDTCLAGLASTFHGRWGIQPSAADVSILPSADHEAVR